MVPTQEALLERLKSVAVMDPQPEIHVRGDRPRRTSTSAG